MSFWLKNVGTFLERLDDRAEQVVEEQRASLSGHLGGSGLQEQDDDADNEKLASILAARGLAVEDEDDDEKFEDAAASEVDMLQNFDEKKDVVVADDVTRDDPLSPPLVDDNEAVDDDNIKTLEEDPKSSSNPTEEADAAAATEEENNVTRQALLAKTSVAEGQGPGEEEDDNRPTPLPTTESGNSSAADLNVLPDTVERSETTVEAVSPPPDQSDNLSESARSDAKLVVDTSEEEPVVDATVDNVANHEEPDVSDAPEPEPEPPLLDDWPSTSLPVAAPSHGPLLSSFTLTAPPHVLSFSSSTAKVAVNALKSFRGADASTPNAPPTNEDLANNNKTTASVQEASSPHQRQLLMDSQKEVRTLRRHVVTLNKQLEGAEAELQAQRVELERAAERMMKDANRFKEEREKERTHHANEMKVLKTQHDAMLKEQKMRFEAQLDDMRAQLRIVEERRMQEGGDWNKELADALKREQQAIAALSAVEDEKSTLLAHISTLQMQQEALGNRLESLSQTAENAFAREREAEDRLDEALSVHARQISQRQSREAELERTISELGAALVAERNSRGMGGQGGTTPDGFTLSTVEDGALGKHHHDSSDSQVAALEAELEALRAQLALEQQRSNSLQTELREVSQERTEETLVAQMRQQQHDRQVDELSQSLARLKVELRDATRRESMRDSGKKDRNADDEDARQIKSLSEEVLRQRDKLSSSQSEIAALKSRLHAALERAQKAESSLLEDKLETGSNDGSDDMEFGNGMRLRGTLRKRNRESKSSTMRSAFKLDASYQGGSSEKIGKTLDALDSFLTSSGRFLRYNPLARLLFIVYLLLIHIWTFVLLFFHTHGFETVHGDFGTGGSVPHGPSAMMLQQAAQQQQDAAAAAAKVVADNVGGQ